MSLFDGVPKDDLETVERQTEIAVVGAGIMGASIGENLRSKGRKVTILDDGRPMSGSRPCGGSIKPSPLTGLTKEEEKPILDVMDRLFTIRQEQFVIRPSGGFLKINVYQVCMDKVFAVQKKTATVEKVFLKGNMPVVIYRTEKRRVHLRCERVVIAAGGWCGQLLPAHFPEKSIQLKRGAAFIFDRKTEQAFVQTWAPYKQITVHPIQVNGEEKTWGADGTALIPESWEDGRTAMCLLRIQKAMGVKDVPSQTLEGYRPFHVSKAKPCYLEEVLPGIWATTGAGKFGCISAAWAANKLGEKL